MYPFTRSVTFAAALLTLSACANLQSQNDKAVFHDSAFNDFNRAPASMTPPTPSNDEKSTLDPVYMRTQADYYFTLGDTYSLNGDHKKAVESFKMVLVYDQNSPTVNMRLSAEYLKLGMVSESVAQAEEAEKKDPKNVDAHLLLGGLYSSLKFYQKALAEYQTVLKLSPNNTEAPLYIGAVYSEQKQYDKAVKYFESLAKNPDYSTSYLAYYYIGRVRAEQSGKKYEHAAEEAFNHALKLKSDFTDAVLALGALYSKRNDNKAALKLYKEYQTENGPNPRVAEVLAQMYIEREDYDQAYEQLGYMESSSEDGLNIKMKMALILIEQKKYPEAITKLEDILRDVPESDKIRFYLAAVYEESNHPEKAVANFKKIPASSQFYGEAMVHAAYILKSENQENDALALMESALKQRDDQPQFYAMYASLLDDKGEYQKAVDVLGGAIQKFSDNAQLRFYYGTMNDRLGHKDVVVNEMKKVLELDPNHVQGMNYLAFTWAEEGTHLKEAEKLARRAMSLEPQDGYILDTLGWILFKRGKFVESVKMLEAAFRYQSTVSVIAEHLGDAYYKQDMVDKAKRMYQRAVDLETDGKKQQEIKAKLSAIEKQQLDGGRLPASVKTDASNH